MGSDVRFLVRAVAVLLIAGGIAAWVEAEPLGWGTGAVGLTLAAMLCALLMGYAGYRGARKAVLGAGTQMTPVLAGLLGGMAIAVLTLFGTWAVVYALYGSEWATRGLFLSVLLYVLLIVVKVVTISQELRRLQRGPSDSPIDADASIDGAPSGNGAPG